MGKETMIRHYLLLKCLFIFCLILAGCGGGGSPEPSTYNLSGRVTNVETQEGIPGVNILLTGGFTGTATTNENGDWSVIGVTGTVTVTPQKEGWEFDPEFRTVSKASSNVNFSATTRVAAPTAKPAPGGVAAGTEVTLTTTTAGAFIYYTLDGNNPDKEDSNQLYQSPVVINEDTTIKATAVKEGMTDSEIVTFAYNIIIQVAAPEFSPAPGSHSGEIEVSVTSPTEGAEIWYTIDGSTPAPASGELYVTPITVAESVAFKAVAVKEGLEPSAVVEAVYTITYDLTIQEEGRGAVTPATGVYTYEAGTVAELLAQADAGYEFRRWDGPAVNPNNAETTVVMDAHKTVKAVFTEYKLAIVLDPPDGSGGSVTAAPDRSSFIGGEQVELTATANEGWFFIKWQGGLSETENPLTITMDDDLEITAVFWDEIIIQDLIDKAADGDVITIPPGTYYENIDFKGKNITLQSRDPDDPAVVAATVIDGGENGPVVTFNNDESAAAVLQGFTIKNGSGFYKEFAGTFGGGIFIEDASPTIRKNIITENNAERGGGLYLRLSNSIVEENRIAYNTATDWDGGGVHITNSSVLLDGNTIAHNTAETNGGGVGIGTSSSLTVIQNNIIESNTAGWGGGLHISAAVEVEGNEIVSNQATENGGGIYIASGATITDNLIDQNNSKSGGGIYINNSSPEISGNNRITNNTAVSGGGIFIFLQYEGNAPVLEGNIITGNTASSDGGGMRINSNCSFTVSNNTIEENQAGGHGGGACISVVSHSGGDPYEITFEGNTFTANISSGNGGGIYLLSNYKLFLNDGNSFTENNKYAVFVGSYSEVIDDGSNDYADNIPSKSNTSW